MKHFLKITLFTAAAFFYQTNSFAQRILTTGEAQYDINITSSKGGAKLNGATLLLQVTASQSRTDMVSSLGQETAVYDSKTGNGFILKEYSGQKLMITTSKAEWGDKNKWNDDLRFTIGSATSTVNGYSCKMATATGADGKQISVYFTPEIKISNASYNGAFDQLPGLPVQYSVESGNLNFTYNLKSVNFDPVPAARFDAPRSGYRVMTYEENQQLKVKG